ncbi:formylglycine-generating enzyme family protein [Thiothrix nivea]|uniref:Sulphatase-modifying factor protein n=1 Tax=Thiothrix nivea (strain ATCC 35100 / DSM 5205 / JP2) TaxID=870187 RepID=A0A656HAF4_THINJ|nr:formylglycine-generating enzyme family protein [Thiothrix nivea]EIJ33708.1 Sulphatase-modifying factor protein [Thiothrix nivea DSM 5205]
MQTYRTAINYPGFSAGLVGWLFSGGLLLSVAAHAETLEDKLQAQIQQEKQEQAAAEAKRKQEEAAKQKAAKEAAAKKEKERKAAAAAAKKEKERKAAAAAAEKEAREEAARKAAAKEAEAQRLAEIEPEMQLIPAGKFMMGCVEGRDDVEGGCEDDEKPAHEVSINAFYMGKYEVTFDQWDACEQAKACPHAGDSGWGRGNRPVINVSWEDITQKYIPWLNQQTGRHYRLPTEAEWEYAARGGSDTAYPWGNTISCGNANYGSYSNQCETVRTKPVGSYTANGYGLYDTAGNVWEWCQDWYAGDYYKSSPVSAPHGPGAGAARVLRGGSWYNDAQYVRSADRSHDTPVPRINLLGFRLARSQLKRQQ